MKSNVLAGIFFCLLSFTLFAQNQSQLIRVRLSVLSTDSTEADDFSAQLRSDRQAPVQLRGDVFTVPESGYYRLLIHASAHADFSAGFYISRDTFIRVILSDQVQEHAGVSVKAIQAREKSGFAYSKLNARQISSMNFGQDFTYILGNTPSAVSTSDAGAGVGYTGIRIRGSDGTRINVTVNGIPINDAESHGVFWVNMPDLASSTSSVQVQRGVGSSTLGSGAFGASINIQNTEISARPFLLLQQSAGSFNTSRSTLQFGTGKLGNFSFSGRLSKILSAGYIDRAASDLQSFQFNLGFQKGKWSLHAVSFGGKEKTYQSWYGTPESRVKGDVAGMQDFALRNGLSPADSSNLLNSGRTYNYYTYKNQTDNYRQNHYQLHLARRMAAGFELRSSFFATTGKGYYEEFKPDAAFASYGSGPYTRGTDTVYSSDLVRQRWLDNLFYGNFTTLNYKDKTRDIIAGLSYTRYEGTHFGQVIWAQVSPFDKDQRYYESKSLKTETNGFIKMNHRFSRKLQMDAELQVRHIGYRSNGNDNDLKTIGFDTSYLFFNPKAGLVYEFDRKNRVYGSYSIGSREPVRSDFIDNTRASLPRPEQMQDLETGYIYRDKGVFAQINFYYMLYKDQLALTGELNDVGAAIRRNVPESYRSGLELMLQKDISGKISLEGNLNLSRNRIREFEDVYYDYDQYTVVSRTYENTELAFSPSAIAFVGITDRHIRNLELRLQYKYVSRQYLDNTENSERSIASYYNLNFSFQKTFELKRGGSIVLKGLINNLTGIFYTNNGYTYKYVYGGKLITENFYYPQSAANFMFGVDFKIL